MYIFTQGMILILAILAIASYLINVFAKHNGDKKTFFMYVSPMILFLLHLIIYLVTSIILLSIEPVENHALLNYWSTAVYVHLLLSITIKEIVSYIKKKEENEYITKELSKSLSKILGD